MDPFDSLHLCCPLCGVFGVCDCDIGETILWDCPVHGSDICSCSLVEAEEKRPSCLKCKQKGCTGEKPHEYSFALPSYIPSHLNYEMTLDTLTREIHFKEIMSVAKPDSESPVRKKRTLSYGHGHTDVVSDPLID